MTMTANVYSGCKSWPWCHPVCQSHLQLLYICSHNYHKFDPIFISEESSSYTHSHNQIRFQGLNIRAKRLLDMFRLTITPKLNSLKQHTFSYFWWFVARLNSLEKFLWSPWHCCIYCYLGAQLCWILHIVHYMTHD